MRSATSPPHRPIRRASGANGKSLFLPPASPPGIAAFAASRRCQTLRASLGIQSSLSRASLALQSAGSKNSYMDECTCGAGPPARRTKKDCLRRASEKRKDREFSVPVRADAPHPRRTIGNGSRAGGGQEHASHAALATQAKLLKRIRLCHRKPTRMTARLPVCRLNSSSMKAPFAPS